MKSVFLVSLFLLSLIGYSQDTLKTYQLDDVTVTANRSTAAKSTTTITMSEQSCYFGQETPAFFGSTPSVIWRSDNGTQFGYTYFTLRGMSQTRINYTLNGIPLNDGEDLNVYTSNYTDILGSLRSVQIIRGAGVSSNGASSYAGLINMDLDSPFDYDSSKVFLSQMYGSMNSYKSSFKYFSGVKNGFGATFKVSATGTDGYKLYGSGQSSSLTGSVGWKNAKTSIKFNTIIGTTKNGQCWLPASEQEVKENDYNYNPLVWNDTISPQRDKVLQQIYQIQISRTFGKFIFNISPYFVKMNVKYNFPLFDGTNNLGNLELNSENTGIYSNLKYVSRIGNIQIGMTKNSFNRIHDYYDDFSSYSNTGYKNDYSIFSKIDLVKNNFKLSVDIQDRNTQFYTIGSNSEDDNISAITSQNCSYNFLNFSSSVSYVMKNYEFYVSSSKSSREPTRTDYFGSDYISHDTDFIYVNPETVLDYEAGIKFKNEVYSYKINSYFMRFQNEIVTSNMFSNTGITIGQNIGESYRTGIEGEFYYVFNKSFMMNGDFNISKNKIINTTNNTETDHITSPWLILGISETYTYGNTQYGITCEYNSDSYIDPLQKIILPGGYYWSGFVQQKINSDLTVSLLVDNLLNVHTELGGTLLQDGNPGYFYSAGRTFYLTANYNF